MIADYDAQDCLVSLEILDASRNVPDPTSIHMQINGARDAHPV
jgi:hypothetical protein